MKYSFGNPSRKPLTPPLIAYAGTGFGTLVESRSSCPANTRNIVAVDKIDEFTIRIDIERPYAPFLANLAMHPVGIVSPAVGQKKERTSPR